MRYSHRKKTYKKKHIKKHRKKTYKNQGGNKSLAVAAKIGKTIGQNIYKSMPAAQTIVPSIYSSQPSNYISPQIPTNNLTRFNMNTYDNIPSQNMPNKFSVLNPHDNISSQNMPNKFSVLNINQGQGQGQGQGQDQGQDQGQGQNWNYKNIFDEELFKKHLDEDTFIIFLDFLINATEKIFDVKIQRFDTRNKFKIMSIIKEGSKDAIKNLKKKQEDIKNKKKPLNLLNQSFEQKKEENQDNFKNNTIIGYEFINDLKKRISDAEAEGEDLSQFDEARDEATNILIEIEENLEKIEEEKTGKMREY